MLSVLPFTTDPITTQQRWDRRAMGLLWKRKDELDPQVASYLDGLYKGRKKGSIEGSTLVTYKLSTNPAGKMGYGRLYGSAGSLERIENEVRGTLCDLYYSDIDIVNAHPTFLWQLAKKKYQRDLTEVKKYCDNRDEYLAQIDSNREIAKQAIISIMYGGRCRYPFLEPFQKEIEDFVDHLIATGEHKRLWKHCLKKPDEGKSAKGSFLSSLLQTLERRVMLQMRNVLTMLGWSVDVLTYDGVMIRKSDTMTFDAELLTTLEKSIYESFEGLEVKITNKAFSTIEFTETEKMGMPTLKDRNPLMPIGTLVNDSYAATEFARLMGKKLVLDNDIVWIFSDEDGMWHFDKNAIGRAVHRCGWRLVWQVETAIGIATHDYSGTEKKTDALLARLPKVLEAQNGFIKSMANSDRNKLLFKDGIYDFDTGLFTAGFDSNIFFTAAVPRPFPRRNDGLVEFIRQTSFVDPFKDPGDSAVLRHNLMRALIGDISRKKMMFGLGYGNSGKSLLIQLCQNAFGSYVNTFQGNDLLTKRSDGEAGRTMGWMANVALGRFGFGTEISLGGVIDSNIMKSVVSGGDEVTARKAFQKEITIANRSTLFLFVNAMPKISPVDDAVRNRVQVVNWSYAYLDKPTKPWEKQSNLELSALYKKAEYGDALFWLLVDEFEAWKKTGFAEPVVPESVLMAGVDEVLPMEADYTEVLVDKYEITKIETDWITFKDIFKHFKDAGVEDVSPHELGKWLVSCGLIRDKQRVHGISTKIYRGIKEKTTG